MRKLILASLLALPMTQGFADSSAAQPTNDKLTVKEHVTKWMLNDQKFVEKAAVSSQAEVALSKLALEKAQSTQVRDFAKQMVSDHSSANMELKTIAQSKNLTVPTDLDREHQQDLTQLQSLKGADFDKAYITAMQEDHEAAVTLFSAAAADEKLDKQLQLFAAKTLPILRMHQDHADGLDGKKVSNRE